MARVAIVLIVDDDEDIGDAVALALTDDGHVGIAARTSDDALALASSELPDLILVDYNMPGVDTAELIAGLRRAAPAVRIVLCTGDALEDERVHAVGGDALLRKPFSIEAVVELLQDAVRPEA